MAVGVMRHEIGSKPTKSTNVGRLVALDLSCNSFTDALSEELCPLLYKRPALRGKHVSGFAIAHHVGR
jgi:nucleotidyltransferase/DNA polymerase involved in DNA repair